MRSKDGFGSRFSWITKSPTEPNRATPGRSEDWHNASVR